MIPYRHSDAAQILGGRSLALCQAVALTSENDLGTLYRPGCALFAGLGHLKTCEVGDVLERTVRRIERHLHRCGLLGTKEDGLDLSSEGDPESNLASSAVSGQSPPAGPQYPEGLPPSPSTRPTPLFRKRFDLEELMPRLCQYSALYFSASDVMSFLGRKLTDHFQGEVVTDQREVEVPSEEAKIREKDLHSMRRGSDQRFQRRSVFVSREAP